jgi:hypothetical protein
METIKVCHNIAKHTEFYLGWLLFDVTSIGADYNGLKAQKYFRLRFCTISSDRRILVPSSQRGKLGRETNGRICGAIIFILEKEISAQECHSKIRD